MPDIIQLLPDTLANQIAAGEVIQRPASAVKELLENAVDAGSGFVRLIVKDAGKSLIQVIDDGSGMSETDARMAFERHATSKIKNIDDLFAVRTMGFRGEALASMAAVAQMEIKTRPHDQEVGTLLEIEGNEVKTHEPCQCPAGTSISLKNLFFNVPARRNFLKSNPVELKHIIEEFQRVALAHPEVGFSLHHNGNELFHLKAGNLKQRVIGVFGNKYTDKIVPVEEQTDIVLIHGFVGKPDAARKTRGEQYFFVNKRFIKNNYLNHAVFFNYNELIPDGSYPFFVLNIEIDPTKVDINVHPTKQEIKFDEEKIVYTFVRAAVQHALSKFSVTPSLDFEQERSMNEQFGPPSPDAVKRFNQGGAWEIKPENKRPGFLQGDSNLKNWEKLYEIAHSDRNEPPQPAGGETVTLHSKWDDHHQQPREEEAVAGGMAPVTPYQIHQRYIVSPIKSGFILIDQQAAHERVLFEQYLKQLQDSPQGGQRQLFPTQFQCPADDAETLREIMPEVSALGFDIQEFGQNDFVVHAIPAGIDKGDVAQMVEQLIEDYKQNLAVLKLGKRESLARSLAQQSAIRGGQPLQADEMQALIDELFGCEQPYAAPNGRPTFITFSLEELEKRFARP